MIDFEKLGVFYLGRAYDLEAKRLEDELVLYGSKDLTTHAVCVGMTGSGKTGLCMALLEEAAIDGIPAIVIDPKGDIANLLLTFPDLAPTDFEPWVNPDDAARKGLSIPDFARQQAELWRKGLSDWGQDGERIRRLHRAADFAVYTPKSSAGLPVSIMGSFAAPPAAVIEDEELFRERVSTTVTSLLSLLGIDADPVRSREHLLMSRILDQQWRDGQDLDLAGLILQIQTPPFDRIGVFGLDAFFPAKERFALAMQLNTMMASPGFEAWLQGAPLDIHQLLYTATGKPRVAIFSIAHLGDAERMFFVSLLLNQMLSWMRAQPGTTSLRSLLYIDELFGYLPPTATPPSKTPLLTLLKQARAFGLGVVLATQNPVDLDYKALSNAGTWLIGRLQTDQDKQRLLDGLQGAAGGSGLNRGQIDRLLSQLGNRVFMLHSVHQDRPTILHTRWVMSYLRGPMTRQQIKSLMDPVKAAAAAGAARAPGLGSSGAAPAAAGPAPAADLAAMRPVIPPDVPEFFAPIRGARIDLAAITYQPCCFGEARIRMTDRKLNLDVTEEVRLAAPIQAGVVAVDWQRAEPVSFTAADLEKEGIRGAQFSPLAPEAGRARSYTQWRNDLAGELYRAHSVELLQNKALGLVSQPGEAEREFRIRLQLMAREQRDAMADALHKKYDARFRALQERLRQAQARHQKQVTQSRNQSVQTAMSIGMTLLGAFAGGKSARSSTLTKASTAARGLGRAHEQMQDAARAAESVEAVQAQLNDLQAEFETEVRSVEAKVAAMQEQVEVLAVRPKKSDIEMRLVALVWLPFVTDRGTLTPAWE